MSASPVVIRPENLAFLQRHVYAESGIVLDDQKHYLMEARLTPLLREHGVASLDHLCDVLRTTAGSPLHQRVVEAMTTNETYFFREPDQYRALRQHILPELLALRAGTRRLRFWCAAASTGQEAYSLAMLLLELGVEDWNIEILGTDLCGPVLRRAEQGRYSQLEVNRGLPAAMLLRHFHRAGLDWQLSERVRRMVTFRGIDLRSKMNGLGPFDVVFCRNVLIYFDLPTKRRILDEIHGTLFRGGHLLLGASENALATSNRYQRRALENSIIYEVV